MQWFKTKSWKIDYQLITVRRDPMCTILGCLQKTFPSGPSPKKQGSNLINLRRTWRKMDNLIFGWFMRIFGDFLRNFGEIRSLRRRRRLRTSIKQRPSWGPWGHYSLQMASQLKFYLRFGICGPNCICNHDCYGCLGLHSFVARRLRKKAETDNYYTCVALRAAGKNGLLASTLEL